MRIFEAIKFANDCGSKTLGEAMHVIKSRVELDPREELKLQQEYLWILHHRRTPDGKHPITEETPLSMMIQHHIGEDMIDHDIYLSALACPNIARQLADE